MNFISEIMGHLEITSKLANKKAMGKKEVSWGLTRPNIEKIEELTIHKLPICEDCRELCDTLKAYVLVSKNGNTLSLEAGASLEASMSYHLVSCTVVTGDKKKCSPYVQVV